MPERKKKPPRPDLSESLNQLVDFAEAVFLDDQLRRFVRESNAIERIEDDQDEVHFKALRSFLELEATPSVSELVRFVSAIQPGAKLRDRRGRNAYTRRQDGSVHAYPKGDRSLLASLEVLLASIGDGSLDPAEGHAAFEALHPFSDGNGRAGRALWVWHMRKVGLNPFNLPFLHRFYYQSLEVVRRAWSEA